MTNWLKRLRQMLCNHRFAIDDLEFVNRDSEGADRVSWPCDKCGRIFRAHCGLNITPAHGPIFRRSTIGKESAPMPEKKT